MAAMSITQPIYKATPVLGIPHKWRLVDSEIRRRFLSGVSHLTPACGRRWLGGAGSMRGTEKRPIPASWDGARFTHEPEKGSPRLPHVGLGQLRHTGIVRREADPVAHREERVRREQEQPQCVVEHVVLHLADHRLLGRLMRRAQQLGVERVEALVLGRRFVYSGNIQITKALASVENSSIAISIVISQFKYLFAAKHRARAVEGMKFPLYLYLHRPVLRVRASASPCILGLSMWSNSVPLRICGRGQTWPASENLHHLGRTACSNRPLEIRHNLFGANARSAGQRT